MKKFGFKHLIGIALFVTAFQAGIVFLLSLSPATRRFAHYA